MDSIYLSSINLEGLKSGLLSYLYFICELINLLLALLVGNLV